LGKRDLTFADELGHVDLLRLLQAHIRFDLPGNRELTMAQVKQDSAIAGKTIAALYEQLSAHEFEIIAVMRREHVLLPHMETLLEAKDRIVMIASPQAREAMEPFVVTLPAASHGEIPAHAAETSS
jgi:Trk K+ transport system NAD-binding subunit